MPIIPQRESRRDITTKPGIALRSPEVAGIPGRITQIIGETLENVAIRFQQARTLEEITRADTEATRRINEIQLEASQDPDVWSIPKYQEKINKVRDEASKGISIPVARDRFQAEFEKDAIAADFNIRKILRKRQIDSMKATMLENIEALEKSYIGAATPEEKKLIEFKRDSIIDNNVRLGIIDKVAAFKFKEKTKKQWQESAIRNAIATDATLTKEMILAGDFKDLTADETAKWTEVAEKKIARNKKIAEDARDKMWLENSATIIENLEATSTEDIIQAIIRGEIDPDFGNDLIKWKTDPESVQYETDKEIWLEIVRDSVSPEQDLREFQRRLARAVADKKIQVEEAAELSVQVKGFFDTAIKFKSKPNRFQRLIGAHIDMFSGWARAGAPTEVSNVIFYMVKELVKRVRDGKITEKNIEEEGRDILEDTTKILYPGYKLEDLEFTAEETGLSIKQVVDALEKKVKEAK